VACVCCGGMHVRLVPCTLSFFCVLIPSLKSSPLLLHEVNMVLNVLSKCAILWTGRKGSILSGLIGKKHQPWRTGGGEREAERDFKKEPDSRWVFCICACECVFSYPVIFSIYWWIPSVNLYHISFICLNVCTSHVINVLMCACMYVVRWSNLLGY